VIKLKLIQGTYENTIIINKSKFIAQAFRVDSIEEIENILSNIRKKYYDATHNCYAYRLNDNIQKMSDDGEPAKTAGAPMLDVLVKQDVTNILVIVTRYFGGTLLGAGGLVRAYSSATSEVLKNATFYTLKPQKRFIITISYSSYQTLIKMLPYIQIEKTSFMSEVTIEGHCDIELYDNIIKDAYTYKIGDLNITPLDVSTIEIPIDTLT
jgi:uncharacterized YigZ family protein